jgi:rRNA-processing protein FCF1
MRPVTTIDPQKSLYTSDNSKSCTAVDDKIVAVADAGTYVATQDRLLRQKLKKKGIRTIVLREKQYLELI